MARQLNWQPLHREETELFDGLMVRHMPGDTPGLLTMHVQTQRRSSATMVYGHDASVLEELTNQAKTFD